MDDEFDDVVDLVNRIDEYNEETERNVVRLTKRYVRDTLDPFTFYADNEFRSRFRFSKDAVLRILLPIVSVDLEKPGKRGLPILPVTQLLLTLRFYATASYQVS